MTQPLRARPPFRAEPGRDEHEHYREHVTASLQATPWARVIKASDFTDNTVGLIHTTGRKLTMPARKYRHWCQCCGSLSFAQILRLTSTSKT